MYIYPDEIDYKKVFLKIKKTHSYYKMSVSEETVTIQTNKLRGP
jgi:hypothetical protein